MSAQIFDRDLRRQRRDRASRIGAELFLFERAFDDILDRLAGVRRRFASALLVGCPDAGWPTRLRTIADAVTAIDPGSAFASAAGGACADEDRPEVEPGSFDLCVAIGTLDTAPDLRLGMQALRWALRPDSLLIGAIAGNDTLPTLRSAMLAADRASGRGAAPHVHPRIDAPTLASLLGACGFVMPVVDVDRVEVGYRSFRGLVQDLRAMGAGNILIDRPADGIMKSGLRAAEAEFARLGTGGRTIERFDILHFAGWTPAGPDQA
jgi:hypothetical protein